MPLILPMLGGHHVAAGGTTPTVTFLDSGYWGGGATAANSGTIASLDTSGHVDGNDIFIGVTWYIQANTTACFPGTVTIDGVSATEVSGTRQVPAQNFVPGCVWFRAAAATIGSSVTVAITMTGTETAYDMGCAVYTATNVTSTSGSIAGATLAALTSTINVADDDAVLALAGARVTSGTYTWGGDMVAGDEDWDGLNSSSRPTSSASVSGLAANATYDVTATVSSLPSTLGHSLSVVKIS